MKNTKWPAVFGLALCTLLLASLATAAGAANEQFTWDAQSAVIITLADEESRVDGAGARVEDTSIIIEAAGTYVLSGTLTDGQVRVEAGKDDLVRLVLGGVDIASSSSAAIYESQADALIVILAEGTENILSDATEYVYAEGEDEPDAALFAKDDLTIGGAGSLSVSGNYRNGIGTKDDLVIAQGTMSVTAVYDGIRGRDSITIQDGIISITAGNDGFKANNDSGEGKGFIVIEDGQIAIEAGHDAIQAETDLTIQGGSLVLVAGGGAQNAPARTQDGWGRGGMAGWSAAAQTESATSGEEESSDSYKGLKAGGALTVSGGSFQMDVADDGVHAGDITIHAGEFTIKTGDDGVHADGNLVINGGSVTVTESYEGLEGMTVTINGGDMRITASDDGINAAGGSDGNAAGPWGQDMFRQGGSDAYFLEINGGAVWVSAQGDGIDSNGALTINGGVVTVHGPTGGGDSALDTDGQTTVNGGTLMAGGSSQMAVTPGSASAQPSLSVYFASAKAAGTTAVLLDATGNVLAEYTGEKSYQMIIFSAPALAQGETYTVKTSDGAETAVTLSAMAVAVSDTGGAVQGGGFGGRGGGGMRQQQGGMGTAPEGQAPAGGMTPPNQGGSL